MKIKKFLKDNRGFTLIEMIVALSIFVLIGLIATNIYLTINNSQRRVVAMQKTQDDMRFVFEALAQQIRLGKINYQFYITNHIDLHPQAPASGPSDPPSGNDNNILALINQTNETIFFRFNAGTKRVQYCEVGAGSNNCSLTNETLWQDITPAGVEIQDLRFIITPSADPYVEVNGTTCTAGSDKITGECAPIYGYACPAAGTTCVYYTDGHNFMPKVRIILKTKVAGQNKAQEAELDMQTTVSSRIFSDKVNNLNFD